MAYQFDINEVLHAVKELKELTNDDEAKTERRFGELATAAQKYAEALEKVKGEYFGLEDLIEILKNNDFAIQKTARQLDQLQDKIEKLRLNELLQRNPYDYSRNIEILDEELEKVKENIIRELELKKRRNIESNKLDKELKRSSAGDSDTYKLSMEKSKLNIDEQIRLTKEQIALQTDGSKQKIQLETKLAQLENKRLAIEEQLQKIRIKEQLQRNPYDHAENIKILNEELKKYTEGSKQYLEIQKQINIEQNKLNKSKANKSDTYSLQMQKNKSNIDEQIRLTQEQISKQVEGSKERIQLETKLAQLESRRAAIEESINKERLKEQLQRNPRDYAGNLKILQDELNKYNEGSKRRLEIQRQINIETNKLNNQKKSQTEAQASDLYKLNIDKNKGKLEEQIRLVKEQIQQSKEGTSERVQLENQLVRLLNRKATLEQKILSYQIQIKESEIGNNSAQKLQYYNEVLSRTTEKSLMWYQLQTKIAKENKKLRVQEHLKKYSEERKSIEDTIQSLQKEIDIRKQIANAKEEYTNSLLRLGQNIPGFQHLEHNFNNIKRIFEDLSKVINTKQFVNSLNSQLKYGQSQIDELNKKLNSAKQNLKDLKQTGQTQSKAQTEQQIIPSTQQIENAQNQLTDLQRQMTNVASAESSAAQTGAEMSSTLVNVGQKVAIVSAVVVGLVTAVKMAVDLFNKLADACVKLANKVIDVSKSFLNVMTTITGIQPVIKRLTTIFNGFVQSLNMQLSFYSLRQYFKEGISLAGEFGRSIGNVTAEFEEYSDRVLAFAETASSQIGVSTADVLKQANAFGGVFRGWGLQAKESADMFIDLQRVAAAASMKSGDQFEYYMDKFNSYTAGPRAVSTEINERGLGWQATTDDLRAFQKELGYQFDAMNDTQRKYVELIYIIKQSQPLLDNLDNYTNSIAFRTNMFNAALENLQQTFGTLAAQIKYIVLPPIINTINILSQLVSYINSVIKDIFNIPSLNIDQAEAVQSMEDVQNAIDEVKSGLGQLDEVDVLQSGTAVTIPELTGGLYESDYTDSIKKPDTQWVEDWLADWKPTLDFLKTSIEDTFNIMGMWVDRNREKLQTLAKDVQITFQNASKIAQNGLNNFMWNESGVGGLFDQILGHTTNAFEGLNTILENNYDTLQNIVTEILTLFANVANIGAMTLDKIFNDPESVAIIEGMINSINTMLEQINGWLETGGSNAIQEVLVTIQKIIGEIATLVGEVVSDLFGNGQYEGQPMQKLIEKIQELLDDVLDFLKSPYGKVFIETIANILLIKVESMILKFRIIFEIIKTIQTWIGNFKQKIEEAGSILGAIGLILAENIGNTIGTIGKQLKSLVDNIVTYWKNKFDEFVDFILHFPDRIHSMWDKLKSSFQGVIDYFKQLLDQFLSGFTGGLSDGFQWLFNRKGNSTGSTSGPNYNYQPFQSGLTPFANGGIVSGRTAALVGEYANVRSNPEVIAPLDRLRQYIGGTDSNTIDMILTKLDSLDQRLYNIQNKNNDVYLDGQVISRSVVNNINRTTITNGRSPLIV